MRFWLPALLLLAAGAVTHASAGQQEQAPVQRPAPDFLFGRPDGFIRLRLGGVHSRAGSDWYDFVTDQLTISNGDLDPIDFGFDVGLSVTPRLHAVVGIDVLGTTSIPSEYRRYVDNNRLPIEQVTEIFGTNLSGSLMFALTERGREVGQLAWVPRRVVPYVGAGGGLYWFKVKQTGDFVDYVDLSVFPDVFESSGWTPSMHVFGGADIKLHRRVYLSLETRYLWAAGELGSQWIDFDPLDLAGLGFTIGVSFPF